MKGYVFLQHTQSVNEPIMLGNYLYLDKPSDFDEEFEDSGYVIVKMKMSTKLEEGERVWIGIWFDYAYGETINVTKTKQKIIEKSIKQLRTDYPLNGEVVAPFDMDSYVSYTLSQLKHSNCVSLKYHPLEPEIDLTPPVLIIKKLIIK